MVFFQKVFSIVLVLSVFLGFSFAAQADFEGTYTLIVKKQEEKKRQRWTLGSWLETKEKIKLMDHWLALNSSDTVFEGFLSGNYLVFDKKLDGSEVLDSDGANSFKETTGRLGLYYLIFGVEGGYANANKYDYAFHLRLLGTGIQNSNLALFYGIEKQQEIVSLVANNFDNSFFGGQLKLYIFDFFGLEGQYKKYISKTSNQGVDLSGSAFEAGVFVDFSFLTIFAKMFDDNLDLIENSVTSKLERSGYKAGLTVNF